jgi:hypothetical protein
VANHYSNGTGPEWVSFVVWCGLLWNLIPSGWNTMGLFSRTLGNTYSSFIAWVRMGGNVHSSSFSSAAGAVVGYGETALPLFLLALTS